MISWYVAKLTQLCAQVLLERALEKSQGAPPAAGEELGTAPIAPESSLAQLDPELYRVISSMPLDWSGEQGENTALSTIPEMSSLSNIPTSAPPQSASTMAPGSDVTSAIAVDSDEDEPATSATRRSGEALTSDQPIKRRKVETGQSSAPPESADFMSIFFSNQLGTASEGKKEEAPTTTAASDAPGSSATDAAGLDQLISDNMSNMSDLSWLDFGSLGNQSNGESSQFSTLFDDQAGDTPGADFGGLSSLDLSAQIPALDQEKKSG